MLTKKELPEEISKGFNQDTINHIAYEIDHDVRNEDWDDEKKGWNKVRWNNRAMAMAVVTINKKEDEILELKKYIVEELKQHLPDCWLKDNPKSVCTCPMAI